MEQLEKRTITFIKKVEIIKLVGSIIVIVLACFWASISSLHQDFWLRLLYFPIAFGTTAWGLVQPLIWRAKRLETDYDDEFQEMLQSMGRTEQ